MTESVLEVIEQINEIKAYIYCKDNVPEWLKGLAEAKIKSLQTRRKILEAYNK